MANWRPRLEARAAAGRSTTALRSCAWTALLLRVTARPKLAAHPSRPSERRICTTGLEAHRNDAIVWVSPASVSQPGSQAPCHSCDATGQRDQHPLNFFAFPTKNPLSATHTHTDTRASESGSSARRQQCITVKWSWEKKNPIPPAMVELMQDVQAGCLGRECTPARPPARSAKRQTPGLECSETRCSLRVVLVAASPVRWARLV